MEVNQIFIRKKSPKINSLLKEDNELIKIYNLVI